MDENNINKDILKMIHFQKLIIDKINEDMLVNYT